MFMSNNSIKVTATTLTTDWTDLTQEVIAECHEDGTPEMMIFKLVLLEVHEHFQTDNFTVEATAIIMDHVHQCLVFLAGS